MRNLDGRGFDFRQLHHPTAYETAGRTTPIRRDARSRASRRTECSMALQDIEAGIPWRTCAVCHYMSERGEEWSNTLRRLLSNRGIKFKDLAKALADDPDEPNIPWEALSRHARAGCSADEHLR